MRTDPLGAPLERRAEFLLQGRDAEHPARDPKPAEPAKVSHGHPIAPTEFPKEQSATGYRQAIQP